MRLITPLTGIYVKLRNAVTCGDPRPMLDVQLAAGCLRCYLAGLSARGWEQPEIADLAEVGIQPGPLSFQARQIRLVRHPRLPGDI